ncbi:MAG: hypothetical protein ABJF89_11165 [Parasphingorhabdus sp.]|uniref:hypothetical protein n=1 Tax=Parasphingorhabdus sp. TaxID=2709688 RepID=UPI003263917B
MIFGISGLTAEAHAADKGGVTTATASAVIHRNIQIRQDGSVDSDAFDSPNSIQVTRQACDLEMRGPLTNCVFLVYELQ